MEILSIGGYISQCKLRNLNRIFLWEPSRNMHQQPTKYRLLNHPFDDPLSPLNQTAHFSLILTLSWFTTHILLNTWNLDTFYSLLETIRLRLSAIYILPKLSPYSIKTKLEFEAFALLRKENEEEKVTQREKPRLLI